MEEHLKILSKSERELLIMAPVYASIRGALQDGKLTHRKEKDAIELAHFKTYTSSPILHEYYKVVEKSFRENIKKLNDSLPDNIDESREIVNEELDKIKPILKKLDNYFAEELSRSLQVFSKHVAGANGILEEWLHYFVLPVNL